MEKGLIKEVSNILKSNEQPSLAKIDELGGELYTKIVKTNFINSIIYLLFLILLFLQ